MPPSQWSLNVGKRDSVSSNTTEGDIFLGHEEPGEQVCSFWGSQKGASFSWRTTLVAKGPEEPHSHREEGVARQTSTMTAELQRCVRPCAHFLPSKNLLEVKVPVSQVTEKVSMDPWTAAQRVQQILSSGKALKESRELFMWSQNHGSHAAQPQDPFHW